MKKNLPQEIFSPKRQIFLAAGTAVELGEQKTEKAEKQQKDLGQEKIEQFRGISPEAAKDGIQKILDASKQEVKNMIDTWNLNQFFDPNNMLKSLGRNILSDTTKGYFYENNKAKISDYLTSVAKMEANRASQKVLDDQKERSSYANNAFNILHYKIEAAEKLGNNVQGEIQGLEKRLAMAREANQGLKKIFSLGRNAIDYTTQFFNDQNLRGRLERVKQMHKATVEIKADTEKQANIKEKKNDQIRGWDERLKSMAYQFLSNEQQADFDRELSEAVINGGESLKKLYDRIAAMGATGTEKGIMNSLVEYLTEGNVRSRIASNNIIGDWIRSISKEEIKNYYRNKFFELASINTQGTTLEGKVQFLKKCKPGQEIKIGEESFIMVRMDSDGYLLKQKGKNSMAYLNVKIPKSPTLTVETGADTTAEGKVVSYYKQRKLAIPGTASKSKYTLDFAFSKEDEKISKSEPRDEKKEKEEKTKQRSIVDAFKAAIRKVKAAIQEGGKAFNTTS